MTKFKFIDRGKRDSAVLIPGWATDYRIFDVLDIGFNYLLPIEFSPFIFAKALITALKKYKISRITLWGWSLGGFLAADFAAKYTDLTDRIILVNIRKRYHAPDLAMIKSRLIKNKEECLDKFYTRCFHKKDRLQRLKQNLFKDYCRELDLKYLFTGLDYLRGKEVNPEALKGIKKIEIIHSEFDRIAPIKEAIEIKNSLPQAKFILIKDAGHMSFLEADFNRYR